MLIYEVIEDEEEKVVMVYDVKDDNVVDIGLSLKGNTNDWWKILYAGIPFLSLDKLFFLNNKGKRDVPMQFTRTIYLYIALFIINYFYWVIPTLGLKWYLSIDLWHFNSLIILSDCAFNYELCYYVLLTCFWTLWLVIQFMIWQLWF